MVTATLISGPNALHTTGEGTAGGDNIGVGVDAAADSGKGGGLGNFAVCQLHELGHGAGVAGLDDGLEIVAGVLNARQTLHLFIPNGLGLGNLVGISGGIALGPELGGQSGDGGLRVAYGLYSVHLVGVVTTVVDGDELHALMLIKPLGAGGEVGEPGTDGDDHVGILGNDVGGISTGDADTAQAVRMAGLAGALSGLGLAKGNLELLAELLYSLAGLGVTHAAAHNDKGFLRRGNDFSDIVQFLFHGGRTGNAVYALLEEILREVIALTLHVLGQGDAAGAGFSGIGKHAHGIDQGGHDLFRAGDAVPVFADGTEGVVSADGQAAALLKLLKHGVRLTGGKGICREDQQGDIIDSGGSAGGDHIGGAGAYGRSAGDDLLPAVLLGKGDGGMTHTLLVAALHHLQPAGVGIQRLAQSYGNAMSENGEEALDKLRLHAVHGHILVVQEFDDSLCGSQSGGFTHAVHPP